jgi:colanic acid/amylovoran biosynthesis glycosyltransferase
MAKILVLFTAGFPFGSGETFLETEIAYLSKGFDTIHIISSNTQNMQTRIIPENCFVDRIDLSLTTLQKIQSLLGVFTAMYRSEKGLLNQKYGLKINTGIRKTMLISLFRAKLVAEKAEFIQQFQAKDNQLFFYSYWCDDAAIGLAMFRKKNQEYKCYSRAHGWDIYFEVSSINYLPYRHFIAQNLTKLFPISEKGKSYINDTWKFKERNNIELSRLGVKKYDYVVKKFPIFTIVSCSNLIPLKRVNLLIEGLASIQDLPIQWFHFGDGFLLDELKEKAFTTLPTNVNYSFMGRIQNEDLMTWYADHQPDVFVNLSTSEGIPVSIMEAMSFGIPAIATNVGGTSELVNEVNGILLKPNPSILEVTNAIRFIFNLSTENINFFSQAAKSKWENDFNSEKNYLNFIQKIQAS